MLEIDEETKYKAGREAIVDGEAIDIGDNIVVPCESEDGKQLWLMLYDKPKHVVIDTFTNALKNTYFEGDKLIQRCYYDLL
jgi:hypothetical protein